MNYNEVLNAKKRINKYIIKTPVYNREEIDDIVGANVYLKLESFQRTGSFKVRGAFNRLLTFNDSIKSKGIVTASSGNHGAAAAYAGKVLGIDMTVVVPEDIVDEKYKNIKKHGAKIICCGKNNNDRVNKAWEIVKKTGKGYMESYDDPYILAGQGTAGYELIKENENIQVIVVPIGGGGLISGISLLKDHHPKIRIIGVEPSASAGMKTSINNGKITSFPVTDTIADGLKPTSPGKLTYKIALRNVEDIVTGGEEEILNSMAVLIKKGKILAEPSGAAALAYILRKGLSKKYNRIGCIVSGSNFNLSIINDIIDREIVGINVVD